MKKFLRVILLAGVISWLVQYSVWASLTITATVFPLYEIARKLAPEAQIHLLIPPGTTPHHFEPSFKDFQKLFESDLIVAVGTEPWLKNPQLLKKCLFLGEGSELKNPHLWLDLERLSLFVKKLTDKLIRLEPQKKPIYERNKNLILRQIAVLRQDLRAFSSCRRKEVVVLGHAALENFLREAGLTEIALAGVHPESEVSPRRLKRVLNLVQEKRLPVVFLLDPEFEKYALVFQKEAGVKILTLNPGLPLLPQDQHLSFFELLRKNIAHLRAGLCR